jgi:diguanylate cyclase (GGDEF)-like protein
MRHGTPLSLLIFDADWFKSYNDTYGHPQGDHCLKQIAESAREVVTRPGDLVARIGGEEFAVILPNTTNEGALQLAGFICESLRRRHLIHNTNPAGCVTVSVGCATIRPAKGQHPGALIQRADEALYAAKRAGRNQVCSASQLSLDHHARQAV